MDSDIVVLVHRLENSRYFLREVVELWRRQGLRVTFVRDPRRYVEARVAIQHVDLTVIPKVYLRAGRKYRRVLNGDVADISKRAISSYLVRPRGDYDGPVIVKTNRNCGGASEKRLSSIPSLLKKGRGWMRNRMPWSWSLRLKGTTYEVFDSAADVPGLVWHNPGLVVERFLPERTPDGFFCLRVWMFLGDSETHSICYSRNPIVKSGSIERREELPGVPDDLRKIRAEMGFDFGKFDYSIVDGQTVLYDVNRTPAFGSFSPERLMPGVRTLAKGMEKYL